MQMWSRPLLSCLHICISLTVIKAADQGYFWQLTDIHYDPDYDNTQESCNVVVNKAGMFGDYECDPPWTLAEESIKMMRNVGPMPDFILWTGDNVPHVKNRSTLNEEKIFLLNVNISRLLNATFPNVPVFVVLGNHDYYPKNQFPSNFSKLYNMFASEWSSWLNLSKTADQTFRKGGYYTSLAKQGLPLRILVANSNLYLAENMVTANLSDPGGQFVWMSKVLQKARLSGEKVLVVIHAPPGVVEFTNGVRSLKAEHNRRFNELMRLFADVIIAIIAAHQHLDSFRIYFDEHHNPVIPLFLSPSVTPWKIPLDTIKYPAHNPAVRRIFYDRSNTSMLSDIEQYYLDLPLANKLQRAQWLLEYSFRQAYDLPDVSASSTWLLLNNLKKTAVVEDDINATWSKYERYHTAAAAAADAHRPYSCLTRLAHLCAIEYIDYDAFDKCFSQASSFNTC